MREIENTQPLSNQQQNSQNQLSDEDNTEGKLWNLVNRVLGLNNKLEDRVNPVDDYHQKMAELYANKPPDVQVNTIVDDKVRELEKQLAELTEKLAQVSSANAQSDDHNKEDDHASIEDDNKVIVAFPQPASTNLSRKSARERFTELSRSNPRQAAKYFAEHKFDILKGVSFFDEV